MPLQRQSRHLPRRPWLAALCLLLVACRGDAKTAQAAPRQSQLQEPPGLLFSGMCDASGAVLLSASTIAVADDESNVLRIYDARRGGAPLKTVDLSAALALEGSKKSGSEADLEEGAQLGELVFWISSHGRNAKGKERPERKAFFATRPPELAPVERVYRGLVDELAKDPRYEPFALGEAAQRAPEEPGGLNIEGLSPRREGGLWIGFRNPIPERKALLAALLNPGEVLAGKAPQFGPPVLLDLGGRGIRAITPFRAGYLLAAGPFGDEGTSALYQWDGQGRPAPLALDVSSLTPEALVVVSANELLVLSDDGSRKIDGRACKKLDDPAQKQFRGRWLTVP